MGLEESFDVMPIDRRAAIPSPLGAQWLNATEVAPVDTRPAARFQHSHGLGDLLLELRQLSLKGRRSRFDRLSVIVLAHEEGFLPFDELQSVSLDRGAMLGVEVPKTIKICLRLN